MIDKILSIDFEELKNLYKKAGEPLTIEASEIEQVKALNKEILAKELIEEYIKIGEDIILNNHYGVITMAGGQRYKIRS